MRQGFNCLQSGQVQPGWIDENKHMNVVYYMKIFDTGTQDMLKLTGLSGGAEIKEQYAVVASRINIIHRKELFLGEEWRLESGLLTVAPRYLTFVHRLVSNESIRAYCYIRGAIFCLDTRETRELSPNALDKARQFVVKGLVDPFESLSQ